jgi:hypothetical protein
VVVDVGWERYFKVMDIVTITTTTAVVPGMEGIVAALTRYTISVSYVFVKILILIHKLHKVQ